jgi:hypothetical protein
MSNLPSLRNGKLVLKTGQSLSILTSADREYDASTLTDTTINSFIGASGQMYVVQGSNIAYIEVEVEKS